MSQQIFDKHWPLAKNGANELIPGAAILQTRDDKDEPITLAAAVQWDESSGLFLPTHKENPLEVRVRELEAKLDELKQTIESGVQLKGRLPLSEMEMYGPTVAERPPADEVPLATIYMALDTREMWFSNGTTWEVLV